MPLKSIVIFFLTGLFVLKISAQKNPCNPNGVKSASSFPEDTTIILKNGTTLTFNRCEFFDIKDCIEIEEIRTVEDMKRHGFETLDNEGNVLLTCGMTWFNFHSADCEREKTCLDIPVKVKIPMLSYPCMTAPGKNRLYKVDSAGRWTLDGSSREVTENGKSYFVFETNCSGGFNCDRKISTTKVKFKAKRMKLSSLNITANCPLLNMTFFTKKRKNIIYADIPCIDADSLMIHVEGTNKNGETAHLTKPLSKLTSKYTSSDCAKVSNKVVRRILGIFKLRERRIYRKYLIE